MADCGNIKFKYNIGQRVKMLILIDGEDKYSPIGKSSIVEGEIVARVFTDCKGYRSYSKYIIEYLNEEGVSKDIEQFERVLVRYQKFETGEVL